MWSTIRMLTAVCLLTGCASPEDRMQRAVDEAGLTDVHWAPVRFPNDRICDAGRSGKEYTATTPAGARVRGRVCCDILAACTIEPPR